MIAPWAWRAPLLVLLLGFALVPFYWMVVTSLGLGDGQLVSGNPWWPDSPTLSNYVEAAGAPRFGRWLANTLLVLGGTVLLSVGASLGAAYALAHLAGTRLRVLLPLLLATYLVPQSILFLPLLQELGRLHLTNSPLALILTYPSLVVPFGTWLLWDFFRRLPAELVESARIEGAGSLAILGSLLLPLSLPALLTVAMFAVAVVFNDFLYLFAFVSRQDAMTIMGASDTLLVDLNDPGAMFATILLGVAPLALLCSLLSDRYASALAPRLAE